MPRHSRWQTWDSSLTDYEIRHSKHLLCPCCGAPMCNDSRYCESCVKEVHAKVSRQVMRLCELAQEARADA